MDINKNYQKIANSFYGTALMDEYYKKHGEFPEEEVKDIYMSVSEKGYSLSPKDFFKNLGGTISKYLDTDDPINIIQFIIQNIGESDGGKSSTLLQIYFDEIKDIYSSLKHIDSLPHTEENRECILNGLLKMVINMAKRYQGMGLPLEDLISAGNVGLCVAWDKFDYDKVSKKEKYIDIINEGPDEFNKEYLSDIFKDILKYGKNKESFKAYFIDDQLYTKEECITWINKNIKRAKFSSVANMWIRAYILQELNNNSRLVKKPKSEIDKDRIINGGSYIKENVVYFESEEEKDNTYQNIISNPDLQVVHNDLCNENQSILHNKILYMMRDIQSRDREIILRIFGIGYPVAQTIKEISQNLGLTTVRVSQIFSNTLEKMKKKATPEDMKMILEILEE